MPRKQLEYRFVKMTPKPPQRPDREPDRATIGQLLQKGVIDKEKAIKLAKGQQVETNNYTLTSMTKEEAKREYYKEKEAKRVA